MRKVPRLHATCGVVVPVLCGMAGQVKCVWSQAVGMKGASAIVSTGSDAMLRGGGRVGRRMPWYSRCACLGVPAHRWAGGRWQSCFFLGGGRGGKWGWARKRLPACACMSEVWPGPVGLVGFESLPIVYSTLF